MSQLGRTLRAAAAGLALATVPLGAGAQEQCEIVLGAAVSLTGNYAANGLHTKAGYDFAIDKLNGEGGVKVGDQTCTMRVIYYDDESTPARGAQLAERLISQDKVQYMLGPYSSGLTAAIAPVTEQYEIPMVEAEGASRSLFNKGYKNMFAILSTSEQYLASAIDLAAEMAQAEGKDPKDVKVAMAFESDPFSLDVRAGVLEDMKKYGMEPVIDDQLPRDLSDMAATLTKVKALQPDVLLISGHEKGAATAVRQIGEMGVNVPMIAVTHCESADVVGNFGATSDGILCPTQWAPTMTYEDDFFGSAAEYEKAFKEAYPEYANQEVPYQTAQASAAVQVFADAFERAGSLEKAALREALAATDMMTFYGPIKFAPEGNNVAKPMVLRQIQGGDYKVVGPQKFASEKLQYPRATN
jgi:branched-chain amino acid transport system substrate-binding protein